MLRTGWKEILSTVSSPQTQHNLILCLKPCPLIQITISTPSHYKGPGRGSSTWMMIVKVIWSLDLNEKRKNETKTKKEIGIKIILQHERNQKLQRKHIHVLQELALHFNEKLAFT